MNFWNAIVQSNTFNFAVLLLIFAVLYKKLNISNTVENLKQDIIKRIENAKLEREQAKQKLMNAKSSIEHLDEDIKERLNDASHRADNLSEQIIKNAQEQVKLIEKNIKNVITGEEKTLSTQLSDKTLKSAIELAKQKIIKTLEDNPKLHDKFIEESIGEI